MLQGVLRLMLQSTADTQPMLQSAAETFLLAFLLSDFNARRRSCRYAPLASVQRILESFYVCLLSFENGCDMLLSFVVS